jgi:hypothetical protein
MHVVMSLFAIVFTNSITSHALSLKTCISPLHLNKKEVPHLSGLHVSLRGFFRLPSLMFWDVTKEEQNVQVERETS